MAKKNWKRRLINYTQNIAKKKKEKMSKRKRKFEKGDQ